MGSHIFKVDELCINIDENFWEKYLDQVCPDNGYIDPNNPEQVEEAGLMPNPLIPSEGWYLICEFETNASTQFSINLIDSTGIYAWDLGDGTIILNDVNISHKYSDNSVKTVKLYGQGICEITAFNAAGSFIVGELDISHSNFETLTYFSANNCVDFTILKLPTSITGTFTYFSVFNTGITGTLDLQAILLISKFQFFGHTTPNLTNILFNSSISGTLQKIECYTSGLNSNLDLSMFKELEPSTPTVNAVMIYNCNEITGITFSNTPISGEIASIFINKNSLLGDTLDLSQFMYVKNVDLNTNPLLKYVVFNSNMESVSTTNINISGCGLTGTLDLSMFENFGNNAIIRLFNNLNLTNVVFANSMKSGTISQIQFYNTGITGTLDLSMFDIFSNTATVGLNNNLNLTNIIFPSTTITGFVRALNLSGCSALGYVDFTKLKTGVASLSWNFTNTEWSVAVLNQILSEINTMSTSGFTNRRITVNGANDVAPDSSSGGYDGLAAKSSLEGKGFTIITN